MELSMFYIDIVYFTDHTTDESEIRFFCIQYSQAEYVSKQSWLLLITEITWSK